LGLVAIHSSIMVKGKNALQSAFKCVGADVSAMARKEHQTLPKQRQRQIAGDQRRSRSHRENHRARESHISHDLRPRLALRQRIVMMKRRGMIDAAIHDGLWWCSRRKSDDWTNDRPRDVERPSATAQCVCNFYLTSGHLRPGCGNRQAPAMGVSVGFTR
jgi:hypothetical protein